MTVYFPYSYIIRTSVCNIAGKISRHPFFGEWDVADGNVNSNQAAISNETISELYY